MLAFILIFVFIILPILVTIGSLRAGWIIGKKLGNNEKTIK